MVNSLSSISRTNQATARIDKWILEVIFKPYFHTALNLSILSFPSCMGLHKLWEKTKKEKIVLQKRKGLDSKYLTKQE